MCVKYFEYRYTVDLWSGGQVIIISSVGVAEPAEAASTMLRITKIIQKTIVYYNVKVTFLVMTEVMAATLGSRNHDVNFRTIPVVDDTG